MEGLFNRAQVLRRQEQLLNVIKGNGSASKEGLDIPEGESTEILAQINRAVSKNKLVINEKTFSFKSRKKSFAFPLLINLFAVIAIIAGIYFFSNLFRSREDSITGEASGITSAEGRLIEKFKQDSDAQITRKEGEIAATREKLQTIAAEKDQLESSFGRQIKERETALRLSIEQEIAAEMDRLAGEGRSQEDIDRLIRELETAKAADYDRTIEAYRRQALQELQEKTNAISTLTAEYEQALARQEEERSQLALALKAQEAALGEQLRIEQLSLNQERTAAAENLANIERQQKNRQLVLDQIRSSYEKINVFLNILDYSKAMTQLSSLENYLRQGTVSGLPYMQDRLQVEFYIIDSLKKLITANAAVTGGDTASLIQTASNMVSIANMVDEADSMFQKGDIGKATELYLTALNEIPELRKSYTRLQEIEDMTFQRRREDLSKLVRAGDGYFSSGNYLASLREYGQALTVLKEDSVDFNRLVNRISEAGYKIGSAEITAKENAEAATLVEDGGKLFAAGKYGDAISTYSSAVQRYPNSTYLETAMGGLQKSMKALIGKLDSDIAAADEEIKSLEEQARKSPGSGPAANSRVVRRLESIKSLYAGYSEISGGTGERSQSELFSLLQAQLLMKQILNSDTVRAEHPELYDSMQRYYEMYGKEKWQEGSNSTMRDMIAFIDILANPERYSDSDASAATNKLANQDALFKDFLEKLQTLIQ